MSDKKGDAIQSLREKLPDRCSWALIVTFAAVCFWLSSGKDLWLDELFTWYQVRDKSLGDLLRATDTGFNLMPVGHFFLLWLIDQAGLLTAFSARFISIGALVGGLVVVWRLWRGLWGSTVALLVLATIVGASFPLLVYAIEVRPYALTFLFAVLAIRSVSRLMESPENRLELFLNTAWSFALPFLSYPASIYSVSLLAGMWIATASEGKRLPWMIIASYVSGWGLFFLVSGRSLLQQLGGNSMGLGHQAPQLAELFQAYSSLVAFPLASIVVLLAAAVGRRKTEGFDRQSAARILRVDAVTWSQLFWMLAPLACFVLSKAAKVTIWGDRFFLPSVVAIGSLGGFLIAPYATALLAVRRWVAYAILAAGIASLGANAIALSRANHATPVRRFESTIMGRFKGQTVVTNEMNTYFHLLYYDQTPRDLRLFSYTPREKALRQRVSSRIASIDEAEMFRLRSFVVFVDAESKWADRLRGQFSSHGLRIKFVEPYSNEIVKEIWQVEAESAHD